MIYRRTVSSTLKLVLTLATNGYVWNDELVARSAELSPLEVSTVSEIGMPTTIVKRGAHWNFGPGAL